MCHHGLNTLLAFSQNMIIQNTATERPLWSFPKEIISSRFQLFILLRYDFNCWKRHKHLILPLILKHNFLVVLESWQSVLIDRYTWNISDIRDAFSVFVTFFREVMQISDITNTFSIFIFLSTCFRKFMQTWRLSQRIFDQWTDT